MLYFLIKDSWHFIISPMLKIILALAILITPYFLCHCIEKHADAIHRTYLSGSPTQNSLPPTYN